MLAFIVLILSRLFSVRETCFPGEPRLWHSEQSARYADGLFNTQTYRTFVFGTVRSFFSFCLSLEEDTQSPAPRVAFANCLTAGFPASKSLTELTPSIMSLG